MKGSHWHVGRFPHLFSLLVRVPRPHLHRPSLCFVSSPSFPYQHAVAELARVAPATCHVCARGASLVQSPPRAVRTRKSTAPPSPSPAAAAYPAAYSPVPGPSSRPRLRRVAGPRCSPVRPAPVLLGSQGKKYRRTGAEPRGHGPGGISRRSGDVVRPGSNQRRPGRRRASPRPRRRLTGLA